LTLTGQPPPSRQILSRRAWRGASYADRRHVGRFSQSVFLRGGDARPRASNWPGLILEVTEDQIINDLDLANDVAGALRELKCELAVDDFGAGYSSLVRLKQLPFSELKDRLQLCRQLQ